MCKELEEKIICPGIRAAAPSRVCEMRREELATGGRNKVLVPYAGRLLPAALLGLLPAPGCLFRTS